MQTGMKFALQLGLLPYKLGETESVEVREGQQEGAEPRGRERERERGSAAPCVVSHFQVIFKAENIQTGAL